MISYNTYSVSNNVQMFDKYYTPKILIKLLEFPTKEHLKY